jgi:hypothetical protein
MSYMFRSDSVQWRYFRMMSLPSPDGHYMMDDSVQCWYFQMGCSSVEYLYFMFYGATVLSNVVLGLDEWIRNRFYVRFVHLVVWIRNAVSALLQPCIYWASSRLPLQCTKKKSPDPNAYDEWDRNCSSYCASPMYIPFARKPL